MALRDITQNAAYIARQKWQTKVVNSPTVFEQNVKPVPTSTITTSTPAGIVPTYQQHVNALGWVQNYANEINKKVNSGQTLSDMTAANQFMADYPQYFSQAIRNPSVKTYQKHIEQLGGIQNYANEINRKRALGQTFDDRWSVDEFMKDYPQYFSSVYNTDATGNPYGTVPSNLNQVNATPTLGAWVADMYNKYIDQFQATNPELANMYRVTYNGYDDFTNASNKLNQFYDALTNQTNQAYGQWSRVNQELDSDITNKLNNALNQAYSQYGPDGTMRNMVDRYYTNQAQNLAAQNAVNLGGIEAAAQASWANAWAVRQARTWAQMDANNQYIQMQQQQIQNYDNIYKTMNEYLNAFNQNYANSKNQYVRETYGQLVEAIGQINNARQQAASNLLSAQLEQRMSDINYNRELERLASANTKTGWAVWGTSLGGGSTNTWTVNQHINALWGAQNYANEIKRKEAAGTLTDRAASEAFKRDHPWYFTSTPMNYVTNTPII